MPLREAIDVAAHVWRDMTHTAQAKADVTLASAAVSAPLWVPSMADTTSFFVMLTAIGGFLLICLRLMRAWNKRHKRDED